MVTNPAEEEEQETFAEAFPDFLREVVTGSERGSIRLTVLICIAGLCLVTAPVPFAIVGIVALLLLALVME